MSMLKLNIVKKKIDNFSVGACSLSDPDMNYVIITGGENSESKASVFGEAGYIKDLSDLNQKRWYHACTSFLTNEKRVRVKIVLCSLIFFFNSFIWLLVAPLDTQMCLILLKYMME